MATESFTESLFGVAGKRVLITGGTSGIGRMIARGLVRAGAEVWVVARNPDEVAATVAELSAVGAASGIVASVGEEAGVAAIAAALGDRPLHVLVNNAGISAQTPLTEECREVFGEVMNVNLMAPFMVLQKLLPNLEAAATREDPARVINISSVAVLSPGGTENFVYSATKSGLAWMTRHLGRRLAPSHVTCNAIAPGLFPSRMSERFLGVGEGDEPPEFLRSPVGQRMGTMEDIAGAVIYLSSRAGAWVTGTLMPVTGGVGTVTG